MKKILALVLALALCLTAVAAFAEAPAISEDFKIGIILLHDEKSTYDYNFKAAIEQAAAELGLSEEQVIIYPNIAESEACTDTALDLVDQGCKVVFADSFGHETYLLDAAKQCPDVQFCHATGTSAHLENQPNFHNAFASIYEGRYLVGVAAGMKLNEMKAAGQLKGEVPMMGYVGAFTYAEIISGYTSFYLGAKSVCPDVQMMVQFSGDWSNEMEEKTAAEALIAAGCDLMSQHADSMGVPTACENAGIPDIAYNMSTKETCPNTYITASRIDWVPYFKYIIEQTDKGEPIDIDWAGDMAFGSVTYTEVNEAVAAEGTAAKLEEVKAGLLDGSIHVFDTATEGFITVDGQPLPEDWKPGEGTDAAFVEGTKIVYDGYFHESEYRSAPYFDMTIDGITLLNQAY